MPVGVADDVEITSVEEAVGFTEGGLNEQDAPVGNPEHENDTRCEVPDTRVAVAVADVLSPCITKPFDWFKDREKSNGTGVGTNS
jgi:hypothetical protein